MRGVDNMFKKILSGALSAVLLTASLGSGTPESADAAFSANYAEALQKSLFFYECQQAGPLPEWNRVEWRADSTMIDEVKGGWYDAGDHVKFNLPMAYTASVIAWGLYQYPDGVEKCGQMDIYVRNLEFVLDYFTECDRGKSAVFQVGMGQIDHSWWGPVELYQYGMEDSGKSYKESRGILEASSGCSAVFGEMAAALAAGACALKGRIDDSKIESYIAHSENLFKLADDSRSDTAYNDTDAQGFYRSSHFYDELFYASNWLYKATNDKAWLDKATSILPNLGKELGTDELVYKWAHCWDDVSQGGILLYAQNTGDEKYAARVKKHLDYLNNECEKVNGKLIYMANWGCARYAETCAFITAVACDTVLKGTDTSAYEKLYETQINYVLGDNPTGQSFVVGYGDKPAHNAHHRTAHCSWKNDIYLPDNNRHILYGALVGGPDQDGGYEDDRNNYINNEVATDYNAGFTAILCKMIDKYGGTCDPDFPPREQRDGPELYVEAAMGKTSASGVDLSLKITNHTAWPARVVDNVSFRYFMDLSEISKAGVDPKNIVIRCDRDQAGMYSGEGVKPAEISKPIQYSGDIYYIEVTYPDGRAFLPISEGRHQCELMLALVFPDYGSGWDATNDFSNKGLTDEGIITPYIPVYVDGKLFYGEEPDGTSANGGMSAEGEPATKPAPTQAATKTPVPTAAPTTAAPIPTEGETSSGNVIYGDADNDGEVTINDVVTLMCHIAAPNTNKISAKGADNADVYQRGDGLSVPDVTAIQMLLASIVSSLPIE